MILDDDYYFDRFGASEKIETDDDFDRIITDRNRELEELDGGDRYDFAEKDEDHLIYEVPKGIITEYGKIPEIKGGNDEGTIFTVTDQEHADNIFRMLGGNSLVEYGLVDYDDINENEESRIWTNTHKTGSRPNPSLDIARNGGSISRKAHSHPFRGGHSDYPTSAYPSSADVGNLKHYDKYNGFKNTKHEVYHPYNTSGTNKNNLPFSISFDKNGQKVIDSGNRKFYNGKVVADILDTDYEKNIKKEDKEKFRNYYL